MTNFFFHGTSFEFDSFEAGTGVNTDQNIGDENVDAGVFLTTEKADAIFYADRSAKTNGGEARVIECQVTCELVEYDDELAERFEDTDSALVEWAEDNGYGGIAFPGGGSVNTPGTVLVFDPNDIEIV